LAETCRETAFFDEQLIQGFLSRQKPEHGRTWRDDSQQSFARKIAMADEISAMPRGTSCWAMAKFSRSASS